MSLQIQSAILTIENGQLEQRFYFESFAEK